LQAGLFVTGAGVFFYHLDRNKEAGHIFWVGFRIVGWMAVFDSVLALMQASCFKAATT
jgi:hypothetical protein